MEGKRKDDQLRDLWGLLSRGSEKKSHAALVRLELFILRNNHHRPFLLQSTREMARSCLMP